MKTRLLLQARMRRRPAERGFILVIGMLFMLVLLMLSAAMFRSFTMQEKIAGNTRDKQRSFEVAQGALQYAESWLSTNATAAAPIACPATTTGLSIASLAICDTALATPTGTWPTWYMYPLLPTAQVSSGGGVIANGDILYQAQPGLHISKLGLNAAQDSLLFQVTSFGGGGSAETRSVVQSTYRIPVSIPCGTCAP